jgi:hypothetical protein
VSESEVIEVLSHTGEDRPGTEGVPDPEPDSAFVMTAYTLEGSPLAAYKRRRRRKK